MEMPDAIKKLGELLGCHFEQNICEATKEHAETWLQGLPEWLGGDKVKKEAAEVVEEVCKDLISQITKQYLKIDITKYLD